MGFRGEILEKVQFDPPYNKAQKSNICLKNTINNKNVIYIVNKIQNESINPGVTPYKIQS